MNPNAKAISMNRAESKKQIPISSSSTHYPAGGWRALAKPVLLTLVALCALAWCATPAFAANRAWTGAVNGNWSEPNNWDPAGMPQNGDYLSFGGNHTSMVNDLVNLSVGTLYFADNTDYSLSGNSLTFGQIAIQPVGSATVTINCALIVQGGAFIYAGANVPIFTDNVGTLHLNGPITINGGRLTLTANAAHDAPTASDIGHIYIAGTIFGSGDVMAQTEGDQDSPSIQFDAGFDSAYTGTLYLTTVHDARITFNNPSGPVISTRLAITNGEPARLNLSQPDQIGHATTVLIAGSQLLLFGNDATIGSLVLTNFHADALAATLDTGGTTVTLQTGITSWVDSDTVVPTVKGKVALATGGRTFLVTGTGYSGLDMQAQLTGVGGIVQSGNAALLLENSNTFSGQVFVMQGTMDVRNNHALGSTVGATSLTGSGLLVLRNVTISGETLNSQGNVAVTAYTTGSQVNAIGTCNWLGPIALSSSLNFFAEDLAVTGPITGGGGLELSFGDVILNSTSADNTYSGTTYVHSPFVEFANAGHKAFSGALVVGGPAFASCEARWLASQQGSAGNLTVYNNGIANLNNFNDTFASLTFNGGLLETGSGTVTVNQNVTSNPTSVTATITGNLSVAAGDSAIFNIAEGAADPDMEVDAAISGAPTKITKQGLGKLTWTGGNSFTGLTDVKQGILEVATGSAFGNTSAGNTLTVETNATLRLNGSGSSAKLIILGGTGASGTPGVIDAPANASFTLSGNISMSNPSIISVGTSGGLALNGIVSGTGPLTKVGQGSLTLGGASANNYNSDTVISNGTLNLNKSGSLVAVPNNLVLGPAPGGSFATAVFFESSGLGGGTVTVDFGSTLNLNSFNQTVDQLNLNDGGSVQTGSGILAFSGNGQVSVGSLSGLGSLVSSTFSGVIGLPANGGLNFAVGAYSPFVGIAGPELDVSALIPTPFENIMFSPAGISKSGSGHMRLSANNSYKGVTDITGGSLDVEGSQPRSQVFIDGGTLTGSGTVGHLYPQAGSAIVAPGAGPGILTCSNFNVSASGPGTLQIELNGTTAGSGYDQLNVRGTVNLTGISLNASLNFTSSVGNQFTIINNDGSDPVTGTFSGLAQNASLSIGGESFSINYTGGSGNDVVLTRAVTLPIPLLTIQSIPPASVRLLWPTNDPAYSLQSNTNLTTNNWSSVSPSPVIVGTNKTVTDTISGGAKFYRLFKP
jgi:autotransporter-associated beta strand protein